MSRRYLAVVVVSAIVALAGPASAGFNSPTLLFDAPTADVLPVCALAISGSLTGPLVQTPNNINWWEGDARIGFSPLNGLEFGVTAYTFADYVLDAKYRILGGAPGTFGLAVGIYDVGLHDYVSPVGNGLADAWPDWGYDAYLPRYNRLTERFSAYLVTSIPLGSFARFNAGLGRGRFVGYDSRSKYFNTDIFFDTYHDWAIAVFGGLEVYVLPKVALVAEATTRDLNTGVKGDFGPIKAAIAWKKMEGLLFASGNDRFGRIEIGATWQFDACQAFRRPERVCPPVAEPVPPPEALPVPESIRVEPQKFELMPIYFDLDKSDIRAGDAEILKRNAAMILAKAEAGLKADVIIAGHCCPYASEAYNVALGARRAESARKYLVGLGVDPALLTTETFGEANPPYRDEPEHYLDRRCEFRWKY